MSHTVHYAPSITTLLLLSCHTQYTMRLPSPLYCFSYVTHSTLCAFHHHSTASLMSHTVHYAPSITTLLLLSCHTQYTMRLPSPLYCFSHVTHSTLCAFHHHSTASLMSHTVHYAPSI